MGCSACHFGQDRVESDLHGRWLRREESETELPTMGIGLVWCVEESQSARLSKVRSTYLKAEAEAMVTVE